MLKKNTKSLYDKNVKTYLRPKTFSCKLNDIRECSVMLTDLCDLWRKALEKTKIKDFVVTSETCGINTSRDW